MMRATELSKNFGGIKAVNKVSFEIKKGKITALIGPNGSGKSTLFNLLAGVLNNKTGKIYFGEKEITKLTIEERSNLGTSRIFQKSRLFNNLTVEENMFLVFDNDDEKFWKNLLGLHNHDSQKKKLIDKVLHKVKLCSYKKNLARELSYGQKRLVEIMRAIIRPHKVLMLDEPIAGVTPALRKEIADLLLEQKEKGDTIFVIEHDMNFILPIADEVIVMDEGKIIATGTPDQIKKNKKVLEAYLGD
jgi:branched-chain amino acid transport system ATP-binding protein